MQAHVYREMPRALYPHVQWSGLARTFTPGRVSQRAVAVHAQAQRRGGSAGSGEAAGPYATKALRLARSGVHDWGLFAEEPIGGEEFVIEYVGERVRLSLADLREKRYEAAGRDNYLFRVDDEWVVDATMEGGTARFINHSCDPNCATRVVDIGGQNRIGIFSKRPIAVGEELCYDYMFEFEEEDPMRIPCLCGAATCRGWLN